MKYENIERQLQNYRATLARRRNEALAERLSRPRSREEMFSYFRTMEGLRPAAARLADAEISFEKSVHFV